LKTGSEEKCHHPVTAYGVSIPEKGILPMVKDIYIPKLGMSMTEAKVLEWKVREGEWIEASMIVLVIETDKVVYEVEAPISGYVHVLAEEDTILPVAGVAGQLAEAKEELATLQAESPAPVVMAAEDAAAAAPAGIQATPSREGRRINITPVARKMAKEHGLDPAMIKGAGPGGRIIKEDVERAIAQKKAAVAVPREGEADAVPGAEPYEGKTVRATLAFKGMREVIAEHMQRSLSVSAQLTNFSEVDMTEMIRLRDELVDQEQSHGIRISYTDLFVLTLVKALRDNPILNSSLIDNEIKIWEEIHIGVAVALELGEYESGLIVPVLKNAHRKSLVEISRGVKELTEKARNRKLMPDDVTDGTFTLTNAGVFGRGGERSTPIINQPQAAILQTGPILEKVVARDGQIVVRPMMPVCLTWDHRIMDGAPSAKFLGQVIELMEHPSVALADS
jgi:pyruvate dehydrogenase E2 component (dihydrolipoamide acetyltransferase)/2-oxoglutarate dehydrogenase E2 component (dihydrolipoamide succinyltransferase)